MSTLCSDRWHTEFHLDDYCQEELYFWKTNLININTRYCFAYTCPSSFVYSDANATGCCSVIGFNNEYVCHRMWTDSESIQSFTWRELCALNFLCNRLLLSLKDLMLNGLLIIKLLRELLKLVV